MHQYHFPHIEKKKSTHILVLMKHRCWDAGIGTPYQIGQEDQLKPTTQLLALLVQDKQRSVLVFMRP